MHSLKALSKKRPLTIALKLFDLTPLSLLLQRAKSLPLILSSTLPLLLLSACNLNVDVLPLQKKLKINTRILKGHVWFLQNHQSLGTQSLLPTCENPKIYLHPLDDQWPNSPHIAEATLNHGSFELNLPPQHQDENLFSQPLLLSLSGCDFPYSRLVTDFVDQNISYFSSILFLSSLFDQSDWNLIKNQNLHNRSQLHNLLHLASQWEKQNHLSFSQTLSSLDSSPEFKNSWLNLFPSLPISKILDYPIYASLQIFPSSSSSNQEQPQLSSLQEHQSYTLKILTKPHNSRPFTVLCESPLSQNLSLQTSSIQNIKLFSLSTSKNEPLSRTIHCFLHYDDDPSISNNLTRSFPVLNNLIPDSPSLSSNQFGPQNHPNIHIPINNLHSLCEKASHLAIAPLLLPDTALNFDISCDPHRDLPIPYLVDIPSSTPSDHIYHFRIVAKDAQHAIGPSTIFSVHIDTLPPPLSLTSHNNGAHVTQNIVLSGSCESNREVLISSDDISNSPLTASCTNGSFSQSITLLGPDGNKSLTLSQTDLAGNTTTIDLNLILDTTPPQLSITSPTNNSHTKTTILTITGSCESSLDVVINGPIQNSPLTASCTNGSFSQSITLLDPDGNKSLTLSQTDLAGNTTTIDLNLILDTTPPQLTITTPTPDNSHTTGTIPLTGQCEAGLPVEISINGESSFNTPCNSDGNYTQNVFLPGSDGPQTVTVKQVDLAGNATIINRTFIKDTQPPTLTITTPTQNPHYTNTDSVSVRGTCESNLIVEVLRGPDRQTAPLDQSSPSPSKIPCSNGTFQYDLAPQSVDGAYTYHFVQVDQAGNEGYTTWQWIRDTQPPSLTVNPSFQASSTNQASFTVNCTPNLSVTVTGADNTNFVCPTNGLYNYVTETRTSDGTYNYTFSQSDQANNTTSVTVQWQRDTNLPQLTVTSPSLNPFYSNTNQVTFSGDCSSGEDFSAVTVALANDPSNPLAQAPCESNSYSLNVVREDDGEYALIIKQTKTSSGLNTTVNRTWVKDTVAPVISNWKINNSDDSPVVSTKAAVTWDMEINGTGSPVEKVCLKKTSQSPSATDSCWRTVAQLGASPGENVQIHSQVFFLDFVAGTYPIYAWVQDQAGNLSNMAQKTVIFIPYTPSALEWFMVTATESLNQIPGQADLNAPLGQPIYLKWKLNPPSTMNDVQIEISTDGGNQFTLLQSNLNPGVNGSCIPDSPISSIDDGATGCVTINSPTSPGQGFILRLRMVDSQGAVLMKQSNWFNTGNFLHIAGDTSGPVGAHPSQANLLYIGYQIAGLDGREIAVRQMAVDENGVLYFNDRNWGLLRIRPESPSVELLLPKKGVISGDGGPAPLASARFIYTIALDYDQGLLVWDHDRIRRINLQTGVITTLIGGGNSTADSIANPLDLQIPTYSTHPIATALSGRLSLNPLPNGQIIFGSDLGYNMPKKIRLYIPQSSTKIQTINLSMGSESRFNTMDNNRFVPSLTPCEIFGLASQFNLLQSTVDFSLISVAQGSPLRQCFYDNHGNHVAAHLYYGIWFSGLDFVTNTMIQLPQPQPGFPYNDPGAWGNVPFTGRDGAIYVIRGGTSLHRYTSAGWQHLWGNGQRGPFCSDGTIATSCQGKIRTAYVDLSGRPYLFGDDGVIRYIDSENKVRTLYGSPLNWGDNVMPWGAKSNFINRVASTQSGHLYYSNFNSATLHQITLNARIQKLAGLEYSPGYPNHNDLANSSRIPLNWSTLLVFTDYATSTIFTQGGNRDILKLNFSTGRWERLFNQGTVQYETLNYGETSSLNSNLRLSHAPLNLLRPLAVTSSSGSLRLFLAAMTAQYFQNGSWWEDNPAILLLDFIQDSVKMVTKNQSPQLSTTSFCIPGTNLGSCQLAVFWAIRHSFPYDQDLLVNANGHCTQIRRMNFTTGEMELYANLAHCPDFGLDIVRSSNQPDRMYYFSNGKLYEQVVGSSTATEITLPPSTRGPRDSVAYTLSWDPQTQKLYLVFEHNGMHGIGALQINP